MVSEQALSDIRSGARKSMNLSFAGCGFLGIYHVGVCSCFRRYASHLSTEKISGASAGALAACALITGVGLGESTNYVLDVALKARARALGPLHPNFDIVHHVKEGLRRFLPDNAHEICSGRLHVSLTRLSDRQNVLISDFHSKEDLIQALNCSSFVPFYSGVIPPKFRGVRYIDGGLTDNIPILDDYTVTVSPFAGESDICPNDQSSSDFHVFLANTSIQINSSNIYRMSHALFPPSPERLSAMCQQGFDDALKFLQTNDLINCSRHLRIESAITPVRFNQEDDTDTPFYSQSKPDVELDIESESDKDMVHVHMDDDYEYDSEEELLYLDSCDECQRHQHNALTDSLPHPVVSALQAGIDSVNRGVLAPVYKLQAYKVLSLMTAPWLLPLDLTLVLTKKFFEWAPYLPSDMQWFAQEFVILIQDLYKSVQRGRHKYSARFTCQLAITETGKEDSRPASPSFHRRRRHSSHDKRRKNLNVGFSVDFHTHQTEPLRCMDDLRHQMMDDDLHHVKLTQLPDDDEDITSRVRRGSFRVKSSALPDDSTAYDTFDDCLNITNQMDAILAYHYTEENDPNTIKVAEIYAMEEPKTPELNTSDLTWDNYTDLKQDRTPRPLRRSATELFPPTPRNITLEQHS